MEKNILKKLLAPPSRKGNNEEDVKRYENTQNIKMENNRNRLVG